MFFAWSLSPFWLCEVGQEVFIVGIGLRESAWFSGDSNSTPGVVCLHCGKKCSCSSPGGLVCKALLLQGPKVTERKNKDGGLPLRFLLNEGGKCWVFILLLVTLWTQVRSPYFFFFSASKCLFPPPREERKASGLGNCMASRQPCIL